MHYYLEIEFHVLKIVKWIWPLTLISFNYYVFATLNFYFHFCKTFWNQRKRLYIVKLHWKSWWESWIDREKVTKEESGLQHWTNKICKYFTQIFNYNYVLIEREHLDTWFRQKMCLLRQVLEMKILSPWRSSQMSSSERRKSRSSNDTLHRLTRKDTRSNRRAERSEV